MTDTADLIDRLGRTALECRALIREMHEVEQSLKQTIKDARAVGEEVRDAANEAISADVDAKIKACIDELGEHTQKAMAATFSKILAEFDRLAKPLLASFDDMKRAQARMMGNFS